MSCSGVNRITASAHAGANDAFWWTCGSLKAALQGSRLVTMGLLGALVACQGYTTRHSFRCRPPIPTYEKDSPGHPVCIQPDADLMTVILTVVGSGLHMISPHGAL